MKRRFPVLPAALAACGAAALLGACSAPERKPGNTVAEETYTPTGSYIPRKKSSATPSNVVNADLQSLENSRINGNPTVAPSGR